MAASLKPSRFLQVSWFQSLLTKTKFTWENGRVTTTALTRHPDLVAIPADESQPTFFLQWGQVFIKPLKGETLEYLPENYYEDGWVEAKFID